MWKIKTFDELTTRELYNIYKARIDVFVVEQDCAYPEVDAEDLAALHIFLENSGAVTAYCRLIDTPNQVKLGRVLVSSNQRKVGLGQDLVAKSLEVCQERFPGKTVYAQAQAYLKNFYAAFGFKTVSDQYLEDGIPHLDMLLEK